MPVAFNSTSTSPAFGPSRSRVTISSGLPAAGAIAARVFMSAGFLIRGQIRKRVWDPAYARGPNAGRLSLRLFVGALGLGRVRRDQVHQRGRQTVVRLELQLLQPAAHFVHALRREAGLDDGGHERRKLGLFPALLLRQLDMEEVEAVERVILVLDAAIHVHAAAGAGVAPDRRLLVD